MALYSHISLKLCVAVFRTFFFSFFCDFPHIIGHISGTTGPIELLSFCQSRVYARDATTKLPADVGLHLCDQKKALIVHMGSNSMMSQTVCSVITFFHVSIKNIRSPFTRL